MHAVFTLSSAAATALSLVAAPACALMAWLSAQQGGALCAAAPLAPDGMAAMYGLMAVLHLPAWLRLAAHARRSPVEPSTPGEHYEPPHRDT